MNGVSVSISIIPAIQVGLVGRWPGNYTKKIQKWYDFAWGLSNLFGRLLISFFRVSFCLWFFYPKIMHKAVYNSMKGNLQRRYTMKRLHLFADANVTKGVLANVTNQIRQTRTIPQRLDHIDEETIKNFPQVMDYPKNYVLR